MGDPSKLSALIALGSNLGDKQRTLDLACEQIAAIAEIRGFRASSWLKTQPIGGPSNQDVFLNGAATFTTSLTPLELFRFLKDTEQQLGRQDKERWGPRLIDIDLLLYSDEILEDSANDLLVPHPRMAFRRFVLAPAAEVAPSMRHPVIGWSISQLLDHLDDSLPAIAFALGDPNRANRLAADVAGQTGARRLSSDQWQDAPWADPLIACVLYDGEAVSHVDSQIPRLLVVSRQSPQMPRCPFLEVGELSHAQAVTEIAAAIAAMRQ